MGTVLTTTEQPQTETRLKSTELPEETDPTTVKPNTAPQVRSESTRKRDTKGPPTRITTPRLPQATPPNATLQSTTIGEEVEITTLPYTEKISKIIPDLKVGAKRLGFNLHMAGFELNDKQEINAQFWFVYSCVEHNLLFWYIFKSCWEKKYTDRSEKHWLGRVFNE